MPLQVSKLILNWNIHGHKAFKKLSNFLTFFIITNCTFMRFVNEIHRRIAVIIIFFDRTVWQRQEARNERNCFHHYLWWFHTFTFLFAASNFPCVPWGHASSTKITEIFNLSLPENSSHLSLCDCFCYVNISSLRKIISESLLAYVKMCR